MNSKKMVPAAAIVWLLACSQPVVTTRAHILERKATGDGRLLLRYVFREGEQLVTDSMVLSAGTIVPHDSVLLRFNNKNSSRPQLVIP